SRLRAACRGPSSRSDVTISASHPRRLGAARSEDEGAAALDDDAALEVCADGAGEDDAFDVAAEADELVGAHGVGDALDVLLDDGALVEVLRGVVGGGADQLYAAGVCLVIGLRALEGGEEAVVDVDDGRCLRQEVVAQDLHVAG